MTTTLDRYRSSVRRRRRRAELANHRLDLQGLRAVAVLAVFAAHLWGWPGGGFVGIDVFFVISGFLVTDSLLRTAEHTTTIGFRRFYWKRIRRIVPAAAVVLVLTHFAARLALPAAQAENVGADAVFGYFFLANWRFVALGTDPVIAAASASPLQHFWALSVGAQFFLFWPALIFVIALIARRMTWPPKRWLLSTGVAVAVLAAASFALATYQTASAPDLAYFSTATRLWELAVGALLAVTAGAWARLPGPARPALSWTGLALIAAALVLVGPGSVGYPAPWALLPVVGTALVIGAGIGGEPRFQGLLSNRISTYLGDLAYALYLVHLPVIVLLGTVMGAGLHYYVCALSVAFGLAIALHHIVEKPLRSADLQVVRDARAAYRHGLLTPDRSVKAAAVAALVLVTIGLISFATRPDAFTPVVPTESPAVSRV
ncbi:acyltransferase family protein [Mycolicibacterium sp.]|uniref:acyltransferase family protein n=1 Tax=Mycolicibacterium sp. TaxID=2320850 RepID=UPI003D0B5DC4